jgi:hypothetical protein
MMIQALILLGGKTDRNSTCHGAGVKEAHHRSTKFSKDFMQNLSKEMAKVMKEVGSNQKGPQ